MFSFVLSLPLGYPLLFFSHSHLIILIQIHFSNNRMVNTRSGGGQDITSTRCAHRINQQNPLPPPPPYPTMEQFLAAQMQLLQNLTATVDNMQQNQQAPHAAPQPRDRHRDFMSHQPQPTRTRWTLLMLTIGWRSSVRSWIYSMQCQWTSIIRYRTSGRISSWLVGCLYRRTYQCQQHHLGRIQKQLPWAPHPCRRNQAQAERVLSLEAREYVSERI